LASSEIAITPITRADITGESAWWCLGCGDFGVNSAVQQVIMSLVNEKGIPLENMFALSGIGCSSKEPDMLRVNAYQGQHGRSLPVAIGVAIANPGLKVLDFGGDGDTYAIGMEHFMHSIIRNVNVTLIIMNNQVYGLTKGQYSPTSGKGYIGSTSPEGAIEVQINPIALAVAGGASFVARAFANDPKHMTAMIVKGMQHKGYSLIDVLQPCVTYNKINTGAWYKERVYKLDDEEGYDPSNFDAAWEKALQWGDRIPIGVIYEDTTRPTYEEQVSELKDGPLYRQPVKRDRELLESIKQEFM